METGLCSHEEIEPFLGFDLSGVLIDDDLAENSSFRCIKRKDKILFRDSFRSMYKIFPSLWIKKCKDLDHCKTEEEIDAFASNVYLNVVVKSPEYQPDEYSDKYIKPKL